MGLAHCLGAKTATAEPRENSLSAGDVARKSGLTLYDDRAANPSC